MYINFITKWMKYLLIKNPRPNLDFPANKKSFLKTYLEIITKKHNVIVFCISCLVFGTGGVFFVSSNLGCGAKPRQSEGKSFIGASNRAQQAYRLENPTFARTFDQLNIGIPTQSNNFHYAMKNIGDQAVFIYAIPLDSNLKSFVGIVFITSKGNSLAGACGTISPGKIIPADPIIKNDQVVCAEGTEEMQ